MDVIRGKFCLKGQMKKGIKSTREILINDVLTQKIGYSPYFHLLKCKPRPGPISSRVGLGAVQYIDNYPSEKCYQNLLSYSVDRNLSNPNR